MTPKLAAAGVTAIAVAAGATLGVLSREVVPNNESSAVTFVGPGTAELQPGQYVGPCSIVTPPQPDPCEAAQLVLRYQMLGHLVNAAPYKTWRKGAPGDAARLDAFMANPQCSTTTNPQPQTMVTFFGAAIADAMEAYACALGVGPVSWPAANPPAVAGSTDKKPPTAPQDLQTVPSGPTG